MGGKSDGLRRLVDAGERVPPYVVVGAENRGPGPLSSLGPGPYAVRSDASDEDGSGSAQAGRYASYLGVPADQVEARVTDVRASYGGAPGSVIVQRQVAADVSGVAFSVHPAGILDQVVVTAGSGPGAVVAGDSPSRTWVTSTADGRRYTAATSEDVPELLSREQVDEVTAAALRVAEQRGVPIDLEWAYEGATLWLLQARPVTALAGPTRAAEPSVRTAQRSPLTPPLHRAAAFLAGLYGGGTLGAGSGRGPGGRQGNPPAGAGLSGCAARPETGSHGLDHGRSTLDNSNLVESYPGLVSPLTASFVPRAYEGVFRSLALRVTRDAELVATYGDVLPRMVAASSGRLYYRMESWYAVLALMPFARRYIGVWQTSLGIDERSYVEPAVRVSRQQRLRAAYGLVRELWRTPRALSDLHAQVARVSARFPSELAGAGTVEDLARLFDRVESELLSRWDVTLLNDARAFIAPALLRAVVRDDARVNQLVSGIASIESLKPVRALAGLAGSAPPDLDDVTTAEAAALYLAADTPYAARLRSFVESYGDRYLEELKLESPTFRTDPLLLIETVRTFADRARAPQSSARSTSSTSPTPPGVGTDSDQGSRPRPCESATSMRVGHDEPSRPRTGQSTGSKTAGHADASRMQPASAWPTSSVVADSHSGMPTTPPAVADSHGGMPTTPAVADSHGGGPTGTRADWDAESRNPLARALARAASRAIAGRESSRLDRARVYGMVRAIALRAGDLLVADGVLVDPRDVFWLTLDEMFSSTSASLGTESSLDRPPVMPRRRPMVAEGAGSEPRPAYPHPAGSRWADPRSAGSRWLEDRTASSRWADTHPTDPRPAHSRPAGSRPADPSSVQPRSVDPHPADLHPADLRAVVASRKRDHASYAALPDFRRLTFAGEPFDIHVPRADSTAPTRNRGAVLQGFGVSGGTATGEVMVVTDPREVADPTGKVLVTTMTDPGWVFLISRAAAVVAERGSLLSHTAIVARELGVPAVVGISDATREFVDGETVTVDGSRGEVRR